MSNTSLALWAGHFSEETTENDIKTFFNQQNIQTGIIKIPRDTQTGKSYKYAYINFPNEEAYNEAFTKLRVFTLDGCEICLSPIERESNRRKKNNNNLYVRIEEGEMWECAKIIQVFSQFGEVFSARVARNPDGSALPWAYVRYSSEESAIACLEHCAEHPLEGMKFKVSRYQAREERKNLGLSDQFTNIYFNSFPEAMTEEEITAIFAGCGTINSISYKTSEFKGRYGYCNFVEHNDAVKAIETLNGTKLNEEDETELYVVRHRPKAIRDRERMEQLQKSREEAEEKRAGRNLYVKNLSEDIDEAKLIEIFKEYGEIESVHIMREREEPRKPRGFGFVCFVEKEDAETACEHFQDSESDLFVTPARTRKERTEARKQDQEQMGGVEMNMWNMGGMMNNQMQQQVVMDPQMMAMMQAQMQSMMMAMQQPQQPQPAAPVELTEAQRQELGNALYPQVGELLEQVHADPKACPIITGLLLDNEFPVIQDFIQNPESLRNEVNQILEALQEANNF
ncbi:hypothetical protein PCE1_000527 [Barthelona sp. PCE]